MDGKPPLWCTLSFDEIHHNEEQLKKYKIDPAQDAVKILKGIICECLSSLGIEDPWNQNTVKLQMIMKGISIMELDEEGCKKLCRAGNYVYNSKALGIYIFRGDELMYFISDAYIDSAGKVFFDIQDHVHNIMWSEGNIQLRIK